MKVGFSSGAALALIALVSAPAAPAAVKTEGTLSVLVEDGFETGLSRTRHVLLPPGGEPIDLTLPDGLAAGLKSGDLLRVTGSPGAGGFAVQTVERLASPAAAPEPAALSRVLVILLNFTDDTSQPYTVAQAQTTMFGASGSVAAFYAEGSWGASTLAGDIAGWYTATIAKPTTCDYRKIQTEAESAARAHGIDPNAYSYRVYVFPRISACGWSGLGVVGGSGAWINQALSTYVTGHELGHNVGLLHAHSLTCGAVCIAPSDACTRSEYGDPFDIMGGNSRQFSAYHKNVLGWLPLSSVATHVLGQATYTLSPMESGSGLRAVRVPAGKGRTYWLEFRQATGFDAGLPSNVVNGVLVRLAPSEVGGTDLLDMTPPSNMGDAALDAGYTFSDTATGLTVSGVSRNGSVLSVDVAMNPVLRLRTVSPCRLADTRNANGPRGGPALAAGGTRTFTAWYACSVPSTARALAANVSVTAPGAPGDLQLFPAGTAAPGTSSLNFSANQTRTNNAQVYLGASGDFSVKLDSAAAAHVIVDVFGYWE